jgi:hypothetical protein
MDTAFAAVLLVSANFLNSEFVANEELPFILAAKALDPRLSYGGRSSHAALSLMLRDKEKCLLSRASAPLELHRPHHRSKPTKGHQPKFGDHSGVLTAEEARIAATFTPV